MTNNYDYENSDFEWAEIFRNMCINLTQHDATPEQKEAGIEDLDDDGKALLKKLITFDEIPTNDDMRDRAKKIADLVPYGGKAMIGGTPFFQSILINELRKNNVRIFHSFTKRIVKETPDGKKTSVFKFEGLIEEI